MKKIALFVMSCCFVFLANTQDFDKPVDYLKGIFGAHAEMNKKYMSYMSVAAHSRRARKIEKTRLQVVESITNARYKTTDLPMFAGDNSLRKSSLDYIDLCYNIFNDDYAKIVNMEEIAEASYTEMEAYLLLQQKTSEKLKQASEALHKAQEAFAKKNNINLVQGEKTELAEKMEAAGKLNEYKNKVFLIFFKCNWQDGELVKALNNKKINEAEQARNSLIKFAEEGLKALEAVRTFNGDPSLANACKLALQGYKKLAETEVQKQTDYYLKEENFNKIKAAMEGKSERTKEDVDAYNKAVIEINAASNAFNEGNRMANEKRNDLNKNWSETERQFADVHMPKY